MRTFSKIGRVGRVGRPLAAAALSAALAGPALAEDNVPYASPTDDPAAAEQAQADAARQRADKYTSDGLTYKCSAVQNADTEANRLQAKAEVTRAEAAGGPAVEAASPELQAAEARVKMLKDTGGPAYKSGEVDRAENRVRELQPVATAPVETTPVETTQPTPNNTDKPIIQEKSAGGQERPQGETQ